MIKTDFTITITIVELANHSLSLVRVGHRVLSRSERPGLSRSFKECPVLSRSFFEFLATYDL